MCITHLPQLAVFGDDHFTVSKRILAVDGEERTTTEVKALAGDERIFELMQMLGATSDAGRLSVEEMMLKVTEVKLGGRPI